MPVGFPQGRAEVTLRAPVPAAVPLEPKSAKAMREAGACLRGISKRFGDSLEAYFERKKQDKDHEYRIEEWRREEQEYFMPQAMMVMEKTN